MYCRRCHYDLRALDLERCPECGTAFDRDDRRSYRSGSRPAPHDPSAVVKVSLALGWGGVLLIGVVTGTMRTGPSVETYGLVLVVTPVLGFLAGFLLIPVVGAAGEVWRSWHGVRRRLRER